MRYAAILLFAAQAWGSTLVTGTIQSDWGFPSDGGLTISLQGNGVRINATTDGRISRQTVNCDICAANVFTAPFGFDAGSASIGGLSSSEFSLDLSMSLDEWTGTLTLRNLQNVPIATMDLIGFSLPSTATNAATWAERIFTLTDQAATTGGAAAISNPEPSAFLPLLVLLLSGRVRGRRPR